MKCLTLGSVLSNASISHVDYLSLDVEGHELSALRGVDWTRTTFDVMTVEHATDDVALLLAQHGMHPVLCVGPDTVFVRGNQLRHRAGMWFFQTGHALRPGCITMANTTRAEFHKPLSKAVLCKDTIIAAFAGKCARVPGKSERTPDVKYGRYGDSRHVRMNANLHDIDMYEC